MDISKSQGGQNIRFTVTRVWKGKPSATIEVKTALSPASCGVQFVADREYVVFTVKGKPESTNSCTNTGLVDSPRGGGAITWLDVNQPPKTPQ